MPKYERILVVCPGDTVTGGPEALHQLVDAIRSNGGDAYIVYWPIGKAYSKPEAYRDYNAPQAQLRDEPGTLIVFPEIMPMEALAIRRARAAIWWLSLENFLLRKHISALRDMFHYARAVLRGRRPLTGARALRQLLHLSQTHHSTQYLRACGIEPESLIDYVNPDHLQSQPGSDLARKRSVVLYNPVKGYAVVSRIRQMRPQWTFVPLRGLDRPALARMLDEAQVYVDFGHHPGRDRLPREAALHGCIIVSGRLGSAGNAVDLPIPAVYKIDTRAPGAVDQACAIIESVFQDFDRHFGAFQSYRDWVLAERAKFDDQVRRLFCTSP